MLRNQRLRLGTPSYNRSQLKASIPILSNNRGNNACIGCVNIDKFTIEFRWGR